MSEDLFENEEQSVHVASSSTKPGVALTIRLSGYIALASGLIGMGVLFSSDTLNNSFAGIATTTRNFMVVMFLLNVFLIINVIRGAAWARLVFAALTSVGLYMNLTSFDLILKVYGNLIIGLTILQMILLAVSLILLFLKSSNAWYKADQKRRIENRPT